MKIDFSDVASDALTTVWGRFLVSWFSLLGGGFLATSTASILSGDFSLPDSDSFVLFLFFTPVAAIFGGIASGVIGILCALCMLVAVFRGLYFIVNDRGLPELKIIASLSFLSFTWVYLELGHYLSGSLLFVLAGWYLYRAHQELREELA
ncbi:MAG: hypothetical protein ACN4GG_12210 [Akkermansiaceae bacterium]